MGETRVDLYHLLQDLASAYPGELEETVLTEIVANALDSGATTLAFTIDSALATLTVTDDGSGMKRADLRRFHDVAASSKRRGEGIGFAGVGIKLGLLISDAVVTETRRGADHIATRWGLTNRRRAPWQWIEPPGLVATRGTAVRLQISNPLSPLLDRGFLESTLVAHFAPLFDPYFAEILRAAYPTGIRCLVDGVPIHATASIRASRAEISLRLPRKRTPSAFGYLVRHSATLAESHRGVAISTYGKVIKRGWDWLGITPAAADTISGLIEAPALAEALTLNKADFVRAGPRGALYLSYRKSLQEAVMAQLALWGDEQTVNTHPRRRAIRPVERDLEAVLADLSDRFPILASIVQRRPGGKRKLALGGGTAGGTPGMPELFSHLEPSAPDTGAQEPSLSRDEGGSRDADAPSADREPPVTPLGVPDGAGQRKRQPTRLGLTIQFETRETDDDLARLIESTVWVNDAHPAYRRATVSRSEGYHLALSVAMALASIAVAPERQRDFVRDFLASWGESLGQTHSKRRKTRRPGRVGKPRLP